jgi:arabinan endo-1,5-alpha-L-arabinosidase
MSLRRSVAVVAATVALAAPGTALAVRGVVAPKAPAVVVVHDGWPDPLPIYGTDLVAHDPSMVRGSNGLWYVFSTHDGVQVRVSADREHWKRIGPAFPHGVALAKAENGNPMEIWAPDVSKHGALYWMYYAASSFGTNSSSIGVATSPSAKPGTWTDHGLVFATTTTDVINAIDPNLSVDGAGHWWLTFGSFYSGIAQLRLDPATGKRIPGDTSAPRVIASRPDLPSHAVEAPVLIHRGRWYYLFDSFDLCCQGEASSYREMVGRSRHPSGPFVDRTGRPLLQGGGTEIVGTHDTVIGPGGASVIEDAHGWEIVYHYYNGLDGGVPRLALNRLVFDAAGWPYLQ